MKQIIKNAIATCKMDRYNQVVYKDECGVISFSRDYPSNNMYKEENVTGHVVGGWKNGVYTVQYIAK